MYTIVFSEDAKKDLKKLHRKAPEAVTKLSKLLEEVREHPGQEQGRSNRSKVMMDRCIPGGLPRSTVWYTRFTMT